LTFQIHGPKAVLKFLLAHQRVEKVMWDE
jgi:hypothetical protein